MRKTLLPSFEPRTAEQMFTRLMALDREYIDRPNVRTLAAYNELAWAAGYRPKKVETGAKKRLPLHIGRIKGKKTFYYVEA